MAEIIVRIGKSEVGRYPLDKDEIFIGRAEDNDVVIDEKSVSRKHAKIVKEGLRFRIYDLGSANGTFYKNEKIKEKILIPGDVISLGGAEVSLIFEDIRHEEEYEPTMADMTQYIQAESLGEMPIKPTFQELSAKVKEEKEIKKLKKKRSPLRIALIFLIVIFGGILILSILPGKKQEVSRKEEISSVQNVEISLMDRTDYSSINKKMLGLLNEGEQFLMEAEQRMDKVTQESTKENLEMVNYIEKILNDSREKFSQVHSLYDGLKVGFKKEVIDALENEKQKEERLSSLNERTFSLESKVNDYLNKVKEFHAKIETDISGKVNNLLSRAREEFRVGNYGKAKETVESVLNISPENSEAIQLKSSIEEKIRLREREKIERERKTEEMRKISEQIVSYYKIGISYIDRNRLIRGLEAWDQALSLWSKISKEISNYPAYEKDARNAIEIIKKRYEEIKKIKNERVLKGIRLYREGEKYRDIEPKKALKFYKEVLETILDSDEEYYIKAQKRINELEGGNLS
ncbi:MAG: FHA domain-containing protein [Acidobacteriota bacterium]